MTKSLFISYDGMTDPLGQSQVIPYLTGLSNKGFDIHVLSCEKREEYEKRNTVVSGILKENRIHWHPVFYHKSPPILSTIYDLVHLRSKAIQLHKNYIFNLIHCRSYIPAIIGLEIKKKFRLKFLFDMRGFWADERVDGGLWKLNNPAYRIIYNYFKRKEIQFLENSDATISLTQNGKDEMLTWNISELAKKKISIIPCCVDLDLFKPLGLDSPNETKNELNIDENEFVLSYLGSIGTWYMLSEMLDFFTQLSKRVPNSKFLFISPSASHSEIRQMARAKNINENKLSILESERQQVPKYLSISDFSIFFIKPVYSKKSSSPTKQGELMAMGIPIICNAEIGDADQIVRKYNSGVVVDSFNSEEYSKAIGKLLSNKFDSKEINRGASEYYSLNLGIEKYYEIYDRLSKI